jgi:transcriptional regulator with XRE-family HTH domain
MFDEFRQNIKKIAKSRHLTYAQIAEKSGLKANTIRAFMCGVDDSRRIAEKIADVLNISLIYSNGEYKIINEREIVR